MVEKSAFAEHWGVERHWCFCYDERITQDQFAGLRVVREWTDGLAPYERGKAMLTNRGRTCWHMVWRQYSCGMPMYYAKKIVIICETPK